MFFLKIPFRLETVEKPKRQVVLLMEDRPTVSTDSDRYWHTETVRHLKRRNNIVINVKSEPCSLYIQLFYVDAHPSICDQLIKNNEPR